MRRHLDNIKSREELITLAERRREIEAGLARRRPLGQLASGSQALLEPFQICKQVVVGSRARKQYPPVCHNEVLPHHRPGLVIVGGFPVGAEAIQVGGG
jgi:hypothetical protein